MQMIIQDISVTTRYVHTGERNPAKIIFDIKTIKEEGIESWKRFVTTDNINQDINAICNFFSTNVAKAMVEKYMHVQSIVRQWIENSNN